MVSWVLNGWVPLDHDWQISRIGRDFPETTDLIRLCLQDQINNLQDKIHQL